MPSSDHRKLGLLSLTQSKLSSDINSPSPTLITPIESPTSSPINESQIIQEEERAVRRLLESWMDRLQLISVLAIFFASTEATLLSITMPQDQYNPNLSIASQAANVGLTGGLLLHILAAFISFLGGFFLIRYRIKWAKVEQNTVIMRRHHNGSGSTDNFLQSPTAAERGESGLSYQYAPITRHRVEESQDTASHYCFTRPPPCLAEGTRKRPRKSIWVLKEYPTLFASYNADTNPLSGHQIHPLPTKLLRRFHVLCVILTLLGFIFSLVGIVCNVWERLPHVVGIGCTIFVCTTLLVVLGMLFTPDAEAEEHTGSPSG
ncbi:hypothetical protein CVT25_002274 [Psilocybe cyanescens]|uniref:Uncharacterized protein n=1 Tax=Psilocybe cyanescens TaxID=93625 RepID=A0A409WKP5_PSICY|nr:hypothetical protein CVT25_002274 [Psilocybe cyanescens]